MVIAVNTRFLQSENLEGFGYFTREVLQRLTTQHPGHQFHFFFDRPFDASFVFASNVQGHIVSPPARHPLLWKFWFDVKVALLLRQLKADVFFSPDGQCSLTSPVPQCLVVHDLAFLHYPQGFQKAHLWYYRRFTPQFVKKAAAVLTVSNFSKDDLMRQYSTNAAKIKVVYNGVRAVFVPMEYEAQNGVKDKYSGGSEYFLYVGSIHPRKNLVALLKAFSVFKRRLQSSMKLVLAGRLAWKNDEFLTLLQTYKYRDDVVLTGYLPEELLASLTASAYALVYPSLIEGFGVPVLEAMQCGVPVLTSSNSAMQEVAGEAALYFDPGSVEQMADALMRIYKDETERKILIEKGRQQAQNFSWQQTADSVWDSLQSAARLRG